MYEATLFLYKFIHFLAPTIIPTSKFFPNLIILVCLHDHDSLQLYRFALWDLVEKVMGLISSRTNLETNLPKLNWNS